MMMYIYIFRIDISIHMKNKSVIENIYYFYCLYRLMFCEYLFANKVVQNINGHGEYYGRVVLR